MGYREEHSIRTSVPCLGGGTETKMDKEQAEAEELYTKRKQALQDAGLWPDADADDPLREEQPTTVLFFPANLNVGKPTTRAVQRKFS